MGKKIPKLSMPKTARLDLRKELRQSLWTRLAKFLEDRGYNPNSGDVCPVNYADTVDFALESLESLETKDIAINVLQEVRMLKHTCPGCGQLIESHQLQGLRTSAVEVNKGIKIGAFTWHENCVVSKVKYSDAASANDLKDCIDESETDLRDLIYGVLAAKVDTTSGYRLKLAASILRDKYADSPRFRESSGEKGNL